MGYKEIIYVNGDDAELVRKAASIEEERLQKIPTTHASTNTPKLSCPIYFEEGSGSADYDTVQKRDELVAKCQTAYGLADEPELVPDALSSVEKPAVYENQQIDLISPFKEPTAIYASQPAPTDTQTTAIAVQPSIAPVHPAEICNYRRSSAPTAMNLAKIFQNRVHIRVVGGVVYKWENGMYQSLDRLSLKKELVAVMRNELEIRGSSSQFDDIIECLLADPALEIDENRLTPPPYALNVANGVLRLSLDGFILEPHLINPHILMPRYFFDSIIRVPWLDAQPTPVFDKFLYDTAHGDPTLMQRILEALGFLLSQDYSAKRFVLLLGPSNSGKSVFGNLVCKFFAPCFVSAVSAGKLGDRFSLSALKHARINLCMDLSDSVLSPESVGTIKKITGRDLIAVESKYAPVVQWRFPTKLLFSSNHKLRLMGNDSALAGRILLLPFSYPVKREDQNPTLETQLEKELPGILHSAMIAYTHVICRNYQFTGDDYYTPEMMSQDELGLDAGSISADEAVCTFLREQCIHADNAVFVPVNKLYEAYTAFVTPNGTVSFSNTQTFARVLGRCLERMGYPSTSKKKSLNNRTENVYYGIQFKG